LIVISGWERQYAVYQIGTSIKGIQLLYISWKEIVSMINAAYPSAGTIEKQLLNELHKYFKQMINLQRLDTNWVYLPVLGAGNPTNWSISWIDIVNKRKRYFHPIGHGYPKEPSTYIGLRYYGELQSIHFIEEVEVVNNLARHFAEAPQKMKDHVPNYLYHLGPAFKPRKPLPNGRIHTAGKYYAMLDTLFTHKTIGEAMKVTRRREDEMNKM